MTEKSKRFLLEERLDKLEVLIREKVEVMSGFAAEHAKLRHFVQLLKFYDKNESGFISYSDFYALMLRFNFVGLTIEIEQLFNRYDVDMSGDVDYRDVAYRLYGIGTLQKLSPAEGLTMDKFRRVVAARSVNATIRFCHIAKTSSRINAEGYTDMAVAVQMLVDESENRIPRRNLTQLIEHFDRNGNGTIDVFEFVQSFKSGMQIDRKRLIRSLFDKLDSYQSGVITSDQVREFYRPPVDIVRSRGLPGTPYTANEILQVMIYPEKVSTNNTVEISWKQFLDFYRCLSVGIEDDSAFELVVRESWQNIRRSSPASVNMFDSADSLQSSGGKSRQMNGSGGKPIPDYTIRRVIVTHSDESEEVVDIIDEIGTTKHDFESLSKLVAEKGVIDIADIKF